MHMSPRTCIVEESKPEPTEVEIKEEEEAGEKDKSEEEKAKEGEAEEKEEEKMTITGGKRDLPARKLRLGSGNGISEWCDPNFNDDEEYDE